MMMLLFAACAHERTVSNDQGPSPPTAQPVESTTNIFARFWKWQWTDRAWDEKFVRVLAVFAVYMVAEDSGGVTTRGADGDGKSDVPRCTQSGQKFCYP